MSIVKRKNVILYFNINYICDNKCRFCFSYHIDNAINTNLSTVDFNNILDKHKEDNVLRVIINGGEPFLNPGVIEMISEIKKRKYECVLYSNGNALRNNSLVEQLSLTQLDRITIPIHGSKDNHCYITRNANSYDHVINALNLIGKSMLSSVIELKFIINEGMVKEKFDILNFLKDYPFVNDIVICGQVNTRVAKDNGYINQYDSAYYEYIDNQLGNLIGKYNIKAYDLHLCRLPVISELLSECSDIPSVTDYDDFCFYDNEHLKDYKLFFTTHGMNIEKCDSCQLKYSCHSIINNYSVLGIDKNRKVSMVYE